MMRFTLVLCIAFCLHGCSQKTEVFTSDDVPIVILTKGNTWMEGLNDKEDRGLLDTGIKDWNPGRATSKTYFYTSGTGAIKVGLKLKTSVKTKLKVSLNGETRSIPVNNPELGLTTIGTFNIKTPGYHTLEITGKDNGAVLDIPELLIGGEATQSKNYFVKDDFYWGRRGPSVHLTYQVPEEASDVLYFYNEINVPEGEDVPGSYFMANGFAEGYFGIQVNGPNERRVLFSVWSPYKTDNPNDIPEDQRIKLLKKGEDVYTGEFGNEGSGGQSYRKYMWKAGTHYRFLLKGEPTGNNATDYTAYFFAPEIGKWELIASFRRPKTDTYLKRPHSFLENFHTETGNQTRKGIYTNQWIYDTKSSWHELTKARFTADATARKESRMDYAGGAEETSFFMKNCGFFSGWTPINSIIERNGLGSAPRIDFSLLP